MEHYTCKYYCYVIKVNEKIPKENLIAVKALIIIKKIKIKIKHFLKIQQLIVNVNMKPCKKQNKKAKLH